MWGDLRQCFKDLSRWGPANRVPGGSAVPRFVRA
jgi:hypothetical protein